MLRVLDRVLEKTPRLAQLRIHALPDLITFLAYVELDDSESSYFDHHFAYFE
jgi:hypothetical protein